MKNARNWNWPEFVSTCHVSVMGHNKMGASVIVLLLLSESVTLVL